jgi:hypothetical protein
MFVFSLYFSVFLHLTSLDSSLVTCVPFIHFNWHWHASAKSKKKKNRKKKKMLPKVSSLKVLKVKMMKEHFISFQKTADS